MSISNNSRLSISLTKASVNNRTPKMIARKILNLLSESNIGIKHNHGKGKHF